MPEDLTPRVLAAIAKVKRLPLEKVTVDSSFQELEVDSMDGVEILFELENEFDITIPDEAARNIRSVREMVDGVAQLLAARQSGAAAH